MRALVWLVKKFKFKPTCKTKDEQVLVSVEKVGILDQMFILHKDYFHQTH